MNMIHISQARKMLDSHRPVKLGWWTQKGEIRTHDVQSLHYDVTTGTRNVKVLPSGQIRKVRDSLIFMVNDLEVFL